MIIKNYNDIPSKTVEMQGAQGASVKVLIGPAENAPTFAMRLFTLQPNGHTPHHTHDFEHEVIYISGSLELLTENGFVPLKPGDVAYIPPNEPHQFRNTSSTDTASFICLVPIEYQK